MKYSYAVYQAIFDTHLANIPQSTHEHVKLMISKEEAFDEIEINIKALRKHMLNSGKSVNAKRIETENTLKHIEEIIEGVARDD